VILGGIFLFALDATLFGSDIFEHIEGLVPEDGHVFCGVARADSASIFSESNIH